MKEDDGYYVGNMNSQELKEGDCDDKTKDDNSECLLNSVASDQRSDISSSKNSEISECDSGVASSQDSLFQASVSSDKTKLSHSYFNSRTGTSFIHINSIHRPIVKSNNNYIEKEWEVLKKKIMKPSPIKQLTKNPSTELLEEQKKDICFIDEPDIFNNSGNNSLKLLRSSNQTTKNTKTDTDTSCSTSLENYHLLSKESIYKTSYMSKSQSEDMISKSLRSDPICSLTSSFYEPLSSKDDYISSSFSKTFLTSHTSNDTVDDFTTTTTTTNSSTKTHNSTLSASNKASTTFFKPLSSIKTSLSHSSTELISCTYNSVSSSSLFNSPSNNPFKVQSYKDEFLSLDPNYTTRQVPLPTSPSHDSSSLISSSSTITSSSSSNHFPRSCFSIHSTEGQVIPEEIELETFTSPSSAYNVYNNKDNISNNNDNNGDNKDAPSSSSSLTLKELSCCNSNSSSVKPATSGIFSPIITHSATLDIGKDVSSKSAKYQEIAQRRRLKNRKGHTTTSDKLPDYVGTKPLEEIIDFICSNENKPVGTFEKNPKKSKKKVVSLSKEPLKANQSLEKNVFSEKLKEEKSKLDVKVLEESLMNGEVEEEVVIDFTLSENQPPPPPLAPVRQGHASAEAEKQQTNSKCQESVVASNNKVKEALELCVQRTESSINSLDHIDKFTDVVSPYHNHKDTTPDRDIHNSHTPPPSTHAIIFDCDIELDGKLIFTEDMPKTGSFCVVTKRKKVKSKHHSSEGQECASNNKFPSHSSHPSSTDKSLPNNRSKQNILQTKVSRESNSAKTPSKSKVFEITSKAASFTSGANESRALQTQGVKASQATSHPSSKVYSFTRPISSPQLHSISSIHPNNPGRHPPNPLSSTTPTTTTSASHCYSQAHTKTSTQNISTNQSTITTTNCEPIKSNAKVLQVSDLFKEPQGASKNNPPNKQPANQNCFFLDTKHLIKPSDKTNDFMFGYDGDLSHAQATPPSTQTTNRAIDRNKQSSRNGVDDVDGSLSNVIPDDGHVTSSLTFVHPSIAHTSPPDTTAHLVNHAPSLTSTTTETQLNDSLNKRVVCSDSKPQPASTHHDLDKQTDASASHELSQGSPSPNKPLLQHPPHDHAANPPPQRPFYPQQHPPLYPLPQWYLPFSMPMMMLSNNHASNNHPHNNPNNHPHNNPNNLPHNNLKNHSPNTNSPSNANQISSPTNNPYNSPPHSNHFSNFQNANYASQNNHFSHNSHYSNHMFQSPPLHPFHRLPQPLSPPDECTLDTHLNSHPPSRHHIKSNDAKGKTQDDLKDKSPLENNIENSTAPTNQADDSTHENSAKNKNIKSRTSHHSNATSSSSSSPIASPPPKAPTTNLLKTQLSSNISNRFNLSKAQLYLDSTFREVFNSKDVKVYPSTG